MNRTPSRWSVSCWRQRATSVAPDAVHVEHEHPQADADLGCGQAGTAFGPQGLGQVPDQAAEGPVEFGDRLGRSAQNWIAEQPYLTDRHHISLARLLSSVAGRRAAIS
jgi:hypothetical protein